MKKATSRLLALDRRGLATHAALRDLVSALIASANATRGFALALAIDADSVVAGAHVDDVLPPIIDHVDEPTS